MCYVAIGIMFMISSSLTRVQMNQRKNTVTYIGKEFSFFYITFSADQFIGD